MNYWLLKTEPETFSIDDLQRSTRQTTFWDGVRNYQARNLLRDQFQVDDLAFFYHSNAEPPGIAGIVKVVRGAQPDPTAFDPKSPYYDPQSDQKSPRWFGVDVRLQQRFPQLISLNELKSLPVLAGMELLRKGSRLSVQPVTPAQFAAIMKRFS